MNQNLNCSKSSIKRVVLPVVNVKQPFFSDMLLICLGLVLMTGSIGYYFIFGNLVRLGFIGLGFLVVMYVAFRRHGFLPHNHIAFLAISSFVFMYFILLSILRQHAFSFTQIIFQVVAFLFFVGGALLGARPQLGKIDFSLRQTLLVVCVTVPGVIALLRFTESISFYQVTRGFGETELNPVGLAYACSVMLLALVFLGLQSKSLYGASVVGIGILLVAATIMTTGSRGATLFVGFSVLITIALLIFKRQLNLLRSSALILVVLLAVASLVAFKDDFYFFERFDIVAARIESMFYYFRGEADADMSIEARYVMQQFYLESWPSWIWIGQQYYVGYPHNQWLEWGARFGLVGIAVGGVFMWVFVKYNWLVFFRLRKIDGELLFFYLLLLYSYMQSLTSLSLDINRSLMLATGYGFGFLFLRHRSS